MFETNLLFSNLQCWGIVLVCNYYIFEYCTQQLQISNLLSDVEQNNLQTIQNYEIVPNSYGIIN